MVDYYLSSPLNVSPPTSSQWPARPAERPTPPRAESAPRGRLARAERDRPSPRQPALVTSPTDHFESPNWARPNLARPRVARPLLPLVIPLEGHLAAPAAEIPDQHRCAVRRGDRRAATRPPQCPPERRWWFAEQAQPDAPPPEPRSADSNGPSCASLFHILHS